MTSRFGTKTYSRPQKMCQSSIQFDQAFGENKKKPSAAKSTGILHRWGKTSFTSIRSSSSSGGGSSSVGGTGGTSRQNGRKDASGGRTDANKPLAKRRRVETETKAVPVQHDPFTFDLEGGADTETQTTPPVRETSKSPVLQSPRRQFPARPNKFFKSGNSLSRRYASAEVVVAEVIAVAEAVAPHEEPPVVVTEDAGPELETEAVELEEEVPVIGEDGCAEESEEVVAVAEEVTEVAEVASVAAVVEEEEFTDDHLPAQVCSDEDGLCSVQEEEEKEDTEAVCSQELTKAVSEESTVGSLELTGGGSPETPILSQENLSQENMSQENLSQETADSSATLAMAHISFRTRRIFNSPKKVNKKSLYKHKLWQEEPTAAKVETEPQEPVAEEVVQPEEVENRLMLTRVTSWSDRLEESVTSIRCSKKSRELYTVVKNVKQAHQCHESGETQEFNDDIEYLLEGLQETNGVGTRCLSVLSLASKCMAPAFRMHLRAHGTFTKVFCALHDAPSDTNLSLCTATVLFILSQDRLNMDLERNSLELILQLLDVDTRHNPSETCPMNTADTLNKDQMKEYDKNRQKVRELCDQLHKTGHAKHLELDNISSGTLAMETLLSLTSRQAGEWFKEELRDLGGLDHIVGTVNECGNDLDEDGCEPQPSELTLERLKKMDRCLRVLENVTLMNGQNQSYLIDCKDSSLIITCVRALKVCENCISKVSIPVTPDETTPVLLNCALSILKVFLNLTNENPQGSERIGSENGLITTVLCCVLRLPKHVGSQHRFDLLILALGLLVNLAELSNNNRKIILKAAIPPQDDSMDSNHSSGTAVKDLVNLFLEREAAARLEEAKTDSLLDGKGDGEDDLKSKDGVQESRVVSAQALKDEIEETLTKALQKAGKHMEDSMIAAYVALLLGCLIKDKKENACIVRDNLPNGDFQVMVHILRKFLNFMNLTTVVGNAGVKSIQHVIDVLEVS